STSQPSSGVVLPSSQLSPASTVPFPHWGVTQVEDRQTPVSPPSSAQGVESASGVPSTQRRPVAQLSSSHGEQVSTPVHSLWSSHQASSLHVVTQFVSQPS